MSRIALGMLLGTLLLQQVPRLPAVYWSCLLLILLPLALRYTRGRFWIAIPIGFFWASLTGNFLLAEHLPAELVGEDVQVTGFVASVPEVETTSLQFHFVPQSLRWQGRDYAPPGRLLLSWYQHAPAVRAGEQWTLTVRLKQPHGFMNPGGFDYEGWLFGQGIRARGYVRDRVAPGAPPNQRLAAAGWRYPVERLRQGLREQLATALGERAFAGVVMALAMGDRQAISDRQWEVLLDTGTNHLVAISGLHISFVAGLAFFLLRRGWRLSARATAWLPAAKAGALAGLVAASGYALLAGFSIPTQRALVMVAVVMAGVWLQRRIRPVTLLALALILVMLLDPLCVIAPGFWLSFIAVAVIFYGMQGWRISGQPRWQRLWWRWGQVQWVVSLGLLPVLVLLFNQASLVSPLANLVAVPWVSLVTVPLTLAGAALLAVSEPVGQGLLALADLTLVLIWQLLEPLSRWPLTRWMPATNALWATGLAAVGIVWLLLPKGIPGRWLGAVWVLPLVLVRSDPLGPGELQFTVLDVGQGLAAVVETAQHTLVFDTGPRFRSGFNTGEAVLVPFLRSRRLAAVDTLIVSHGDNDHAGGVAGLLHRVQVGEVLSSVPGLLPVAARPCEAGQRWRWDGVEFEILHPQAGDYASGLGDNNLSCVLRIDSGHRQLLLSGDIERVAEQLLISRAGGRLPAQVLVAPHHGSLTSSSPAFVAAVSPSIVVFAAGYQNRFGFPKPQVVGRYLEHGAQLFTTAEHGAVSIRIGAGGGTVISTYRQAAARYWHHQPARRDFGESAERPSLSPSASLLQ